MVLLLLYLCTTVLTLVHPTQSYTWTSCKLPLNYCHYLDQHLTLTPVQNALLWHAKDAVQSSPSTATTTATVEMYRTPTSPSNYMRPSAPEIPNIVHFVFGMGDQRADFHYAYFLNVVATALVLRPKKIFMHYATEPSGKWWKEIQPMLHLEKYNLEDTKHVFGIYLRHYAHRADIVRLDAVRNLIFDTIKYLYTLNLTYIFKLCS